MRVTKYMPNLVSLSKYYLKSVIYDLKLEYTKEWAVKELELSQRELY